MKKRLLSAFVFLAYIAILIKVMVFKDIPTIRIGQLMLNFGGADAGHAPNFVPFATIMPYLFGYKGWIIAGINLVGNIALLIPLGFLLPFIYPNMTWKKSLVVALVSGLIIETMQTVLHVGIFDIDDVILNALGVMIGYGASVILVKWARSRSYANICIAAAIVVALAAAAFYTVYPWNQPVVNPGVESAQDEENATPSGGDLCGGTGGAGQIVSVEDNSFTIELRDGRNQVITLATQATIKTLTGPASYSDLKIGDRVTLVGDGNQDGSFTAHTVLVCNS